MKHIVNNLNSKLEPIREVATAGFVLAYNYTLIGPDHYHCEYSPEWQIEYGQNSYLAKDPAVRWGATNTGVISWAELHDDDEHDVLQAASRSGLRFGIVMAFVFNNRRCFLGASRPDRDLTASEIAVCKTVFTSLYHELYITLDLTEKELGFLRLLAKGKEQKEISDQLYLSESGVKYRAQAILKKMNVRNRTEAVSVAIRHKLI